MKADISRPQPGDPYYNKPPKGYSVCILGNYPKGAKPSQRTGYPGLTCLPNCVGFAVGFLNASNGCKDFSMLGSYQAYALIAAAKRQGLEVTQEPTLGGIMVWSKNGMAGHCAVVKELRGSSAVVTAESEWNGVVYAEYTRIKGDGDWRNGCYWMGTAYHYRGCIKNPAYEVENMTIDELIEKMTPEQAYKLSEKARAHAATLPVSSYAEAACREIVEKGIAADGNGDGSMDSPKAPLLRQEFCVFLKRAGILGREV